MGTKCCSSRRTKTPKKSDRNQTMINSNSIPSANGVFLANEILKQRNIQMMVAIYGVFEVMRACPPTGKIEEIRKANQAKLKSTLKFEESQAMKKYSSFLSEAEYISIINSKQGASLFKERNREIESIIYGALSGKWIFPLKSIPPSSIYIDFYRHEKALNLFLCQDIISSPPQLTKEKAVNIWADMDIRLCKKLREIIDNFMDPSPDLVYQFHLLGEHYRLSGSEDGEAIQNIQEFYEELLEMIQKQKVTIPYINFERKYDTVEVQNYYQNLLKIGQSLSIVKTSATQELQRVLQAHKQVLYYMLNIEGQ